MRLLSRVGQQPHFLSANLIHMGKDNAMPRIQIATAADLDAWLQLAAEVEPLFGPMVNEPSFRAALVNNFQRGTAYCLRDGDEQPGNVLLGGLLFSPKAPNYRISWLAVTERARGRGYGAALLLHALDQVIPPATISVTTFGEDNSAGKPACQLYMRYGFLPAEMTEPGPEGGTRQIFRLHYPNCGNFQADF